MGLADLLESEPISTTIVGIEREYRVLGATGAPIDFRRLITDLTIPGGRLDPSDPNAHHLPSGVLVTADGPEAEAAIPPVPAHPGFAMHASAWARRSEDELLAVLPPQSAIEGYSTHLNVSIGGDVVRLASLAATRFGVALMTLLDLADSPGLLVRPRPGRLEVGGDFVDGEQLRVALTFAVAATRACADALARGDTSGLPDPGPRPVRAKDRPGSFVALTLDRDALSEGWQAARAHLAGLASTGEIATVDDVVHGRRPIPSEALTDADAPAANATSPFGRLAPRVRGSLRVEIAALTWAATTFHVTAPDRDVYAFVPRRWLQSFLDRLDAGDLDDVLAHGKPERRARAEPVLLDPPFDPRTVVAPEPMDAGGRLRRRVPELAGAGAGIAGVLAVHHFWP